MTYCIVFDLKNQEKNYIDFFNKLKSHDKIDQILSNAFFINSSETKTQIYASLKPFVDESDLLLIIETPSLESLSGWLSVSSIEWLEDNFKDEEI